MYEFKHIQLPDDHKFDDDHLAFLQTIDEGLVNAAEKSVKKEDLEAKQKELEEKLSELKNSFKYDEVKEQLREAFIEMEKIRAEKPVISKEEKQAKELELNNKWIRAMLRKDRDGLKAISNELKELEVKTELEPVMHTGAGSDMLSTDASQGSYLIPELLLAEVNRFVVSGGIARREMRYLPFSGAGNSRYIPTLLTNVTVGWVDEGERKEKTKPITSRVQQTLKTVAAMVIMTEEIVEDSAINLTAWCGQLLGEAIAAEEDDQFFAGTGAPWTGILNDTNVATYQLDATEGITDITPNDLLDMLSEIPTNARAGGKFYMHQTVLDRIISYRASAVAAGDGEGAFLVTDPKEAGAYRIWGYPVVVSDSLPDIDDDDGDADYPFLFFGNLQKCCVYGDKKGIRVKILDQASVYDENDELINLAEQDMVALRVHKRVGYVIVLPAGIVVLQTGASS
jgi:HK97 family phage major capsid protein